jgi:hypothetical protein
MNAWIFFFGELHVRCQMTLLEVLPFFVLSTNGEGFGTCLPASQPSNSEAANSYAVTVKIQLRFSPDNSEIFCFVTMSPGRQGSTNVRLASPGTHPPTPTRLPQFSTRLSLVIYAVSVVASPSNNPSRSSAPEERRKPLNSQISS